GDGNQTRDFTYIKDVISANCRAMDSDATGVYNIACGKRISLNELAALLMTITGNHPAPIYEPPREGDIRDSLADISRARAAFGYDPRYTLEEGLAETVAWFQDRLKIDLRTD
ncbi:MAG: NAD-dependent epimerase/dehydratase family protein, partial [Methanocalculus sp. MSAO_Arc2]|uniref:GDP-mannose 4,6-dehydratase n=1 Tax=Methanocalculus sp. MSAO_Arc2 TaxID=2293855 RepID=UPI000FF2C8EC